jgi:hypothetical protein
VEAGKCGAVGSSGKPGATESYRASGGARRRLEKPKSGAPPPASTAETHMMAALQDFIALGRSKRATQFPTTRSLLDVHKPLFPRSNPPTSSLDLSTADRRQRVRQQDSTFATIKLYPTRLPETSVELAFCGGQKRFVRLELALSLFSGTAINPYSTCFLYLLYPRFRSHPFPFVTSHHNCASAITQPNG